jgi:hypothetical protein
MEINSRLQLEHTSVAQSFASLVPVRLTLAADVRHRGVSALNHPMTLGRTT